MAPYQDQNTSFKMEPENETDNFETHVYNSSLLNHEQEDKFLNIHLLIKVLDYQKRVHIFGFQS